VTLKIPLGIPQRDQRALGKAIIRSPAMVTLKIKALVAFMEMGALNFQAWE
jgi:hypothetical protein